MTDSSVSLLNSFVPFIEVSRENFAEFQRQVYDYAASVCVDNGFLPHRHGLLSYIVPTDTWQQH